MGKPYFLCKKFVRKKRKLPSKIDFFGSTLGVWWGLLFCHLAWSCTCGIRGPTGWDCAGCRGSASFWVSGVLSKIKYKLSIFNLQLKNKHKSWEYGLFQKQEEEKKLKNKKEKILSPKIRKKKVWTSTLSWNQSHHTKPIQSLISSSWSSNITKPNQIQLGCDSVEIKSCYNSLHSSSV